MNKNTCWGLGLASENELLGRAVLEYLQKEAPQMERLSLIE